MRPVVRNGTANEYLAQLTMCSDSISRIFNAADRAERYGRESVSVRGPKGPVPIPAKIMATPLEARLSEKGKQAILDTRSGIRLDSDKYHKTFQAIARDKDRNN